MKLGADIEYILENEGGFVSARSLFEFKEQASGYLGGYGTDGNSCVFEIRPRPGITAVSVVDRIEGIINEVVLKLTGSYKIVGGAYHYSEPVSCHIHYGMSYKALVGVDKLLHTALAWPIRILFVDQESINKRMGSAGYGFTRSGNSGWYRSYGSDPHCEYRVPPNFVINKKVATVVFAYALAILPYMGCMLDYVDCFGDYNTVTGDFDFERCKCLIVSFLSTLYDWTHNKAIMDMFELVKQAPLIPKLPDALSLWNVELSKLSWESECEKIHLFNFTDDEGLEKYSGYFTDLTNPFVKSKKDKLTIYGSNEHRGPCIFVSQKVKDLWDADCVEAFTDVHRCSMYINDTVGLKVDAFSSFKEGYCVGIPYWARSGSVFTAVVNLIRVIGSRIVDTAGG